MQTALIQHTNGHAGLSFDLRQMPSLQPLPAPGHDDRPGFGLLRQVLDALRLGLLLVDAEGRVLHANHTARALCKAGAPLHLCDGALSLTPADQRALDLALAAAGRGKWSMLVLNRGKTDLSVGVVPMADPSGSTAPAAMLVIAPGCQPSSLALQFFSQAHGLTSAESAVLLALCRGQRPSEIAAAGGVAVCTVRTQISAVRSKARAASVNHLIRMAAALPPMACMALDDGLHGARG